MTEFISEFIGIFIGSILYYWESKMRERIWLP